MRKMLTAVALAALTVVAAACGSGPVDPDTMGGMNGMRVAAADSSALR